MTTRNKRISTIKATCVHCGNQGDIKIEEGEMLEYTFGEELWVEYSVIECLDCGEKDFSN